VIITSGATLGLNLAAHSLGAELREGDEIVVSLLEHHSNLVPWQMLCERTGARLRAIGITRDGRLDLERLEEVVTDRCRIVAVTHCSNVTGALTDLGRIVEAARAVGAHIVVDGAQRAPHGPLEVRALDIDAYVISGHKMFGPTGAGAIWLRGELAERLPPFLGGGEMIRTVTLERTTYARPPHRFEAGTPPIGPAIGMGAAAHFLAGIDWGAALDHELSLTARLIDGLQRRDGMRILGPTGLQGRLGVVSFAADGIHAHDLCQMLDGYGVCLRGGHHCAQPLMEAFDLAATARASIALYNTRGDIEALLDGLDHTLERLR
jgi:cysteine desulfurase / selenocysteine lyase